MVNYVTKAHNNTCLNLPHLVNKDPTNLERTQHSDEQALGDSEDEEPPLNRKRVPEEPVSVRGIY